MGERGRGVAAEQRFEFGAQLRGRLEAAVAASRLSWKKRFSAPGMWPATGRAARPRRGSAPARGRRSRARGRVAAASSAASTASSAGPVGIGRRGPARRRRVADERAAGRRQAATPPSSTATSAWPIQRSIHHRRAAYTPPWRSSATTWRLRRDADAAEHRGEGAPVGQRMAAVACRSSAPTGRGRDAGRPSRAHGPSRQACARRRRRRRGRSSRR